MTRPQFDGIYSGGRQHLTSAPLIDRIVNTLGQKKHINGVGGSTKMFFSCRNGTSTESDTFAEATLSTCTIEDEQTASLASTFAMLVPSSGVRLKIFSLSPIIDYRRPQRCVDASLCRSASTWVVNSETLPPDGCELPLRDRTERADAR